MPPQLFNNIDHSLIDCFPFSKPSHFSLDLNSNFHGINWMNSEGRSATCNTSKDEWFDIVPNPTNNLHYLNFLKKRKDLLIFNK
jgi:hypothetical protein